MSQVDPQKLAVDAIRCLSMDGVQQAKSGHPGAPMALAPVAYLLYKEIMSHNPADPTWMNRDRFILSNGHASMLLYASLHLSGYEVSLEDLKQFRQMNSKTPGHPEYGYTPGVETTTGPLGQGFMHGLGMAMAEAHLASEYNTEDLKIIDHYTYAICSDGDLMEGASHEAASLAGHLGLGKMIYLYDDNHISIEGDTDITFTEDVQKRFEAYGWHVVNLGDVANDLDKIRHAYVEARAETQRPSLIILRTHIGFGSPNLQGSEKSHGSPLGEEEVERTKEALGYPSVEPFFVPEGVREHMQTIETDGAQAQAKWQDRLAEYQDRYPEKYERLQAAYSQELPKNWDEDLPEYKQEAGAVATRAVNSKVLNSLAPKIHWLMGGSADLTPSTKTEMSGMGLYGSANYQGRNIAWGVREMAMAAAAAGMSLHGGVRPYTATFFVFTDYARAAMRLSALMGQPVIYVMTHDSIGLGEDGPTHQPIEHLASLRAMPNVHVIRPADANETVVAWKEAIKRREGPTVLVLSRQGLPILDSETAKELSKGAYVVSKEKSDTPEVILIGTGSEVHIALAAKTQFGDIGANVRVVSMPSWELFEKQEASYKETILPTGIPRISVEAASTMGWHRWVGEQGTAIGIDSFGMSAPYKEIYDAFGITPEAVANILSIYL